MVCIDDNDGGTSGVSQSLSINSTMQQLLIDTYSVIGEPDGLYGTMASHDVDPAARVKFYHHEGNWHRALSAYNLLHFQPHPPDGLLQVTLNYDTCNLTYLCISVCIILVYLMLHQFTYLAYLLLTVVHLSM